MNKLPEDQKNKRLWREAEKLAEEVVSESSEEQDGGLDWGRLLAKPWPGLPIAVAAVVILLLVIVGLGMGLRNYLVLPVLRGLIIPRIVGLTEAVLPPGTTREVLVGEYGFLVKGLEWPFGLVLPYVVSFYLALIVMEDTGYMSRFASLLEGLLNKLGLRGSSVISLILGFGCAIPAILSTRSLTTRKERMIVSFIVPLAIPCIAETGAFISLLAERSIFLVFGLFGFAGMVLIVAGRMLNWLLEGDLPPALSEIPVLLPPNFKVVGKKLWTRVKSFLLRGAVPLVAAVGIAALIYETRALDFLAGGLQPLVTDWLGLPQEAVTPLFLGIFRRELTVLPLLEMELTHLQAFTGAVVGLFYVPCIAVFATVSREFGLLFAMGLLVATVSLAFFVGGVVFQAGTLFLVALS